MIKDNELHQETATTIEIEVIQETAMTIIDNHRIDNEHHQDTVIVSEVFPDNRINVTDPEIVINHRTDRQIINFHPINNNTNNKLSIHQPMPFNQCQ